MNRAAIRLCMLAILPACGVAAAQSRIEYKTVAEAREALLSKPGLERLNQDGWMVFSDRSGMVMWTFAPDDHEANPAVAKRAIVKDGDAVNLHMSILCEASKAACDRLSQTFQDLNAQMIKAMEEAAKSPQ